MTKNLETVELGFEGKNLRLILDTMSKLYAVPPVAAVREYLSNAYDSHVKVNQSAPVQLTLKKKRTKNLFDDGYRSNSRVGIYDIIIKDRGEGMSKEEMLSLLANYGSSSKKNSHKQQGKFGYGTKSGLAVTDRVTFQSVKDNWSTTAEYSAKENTIELNILYHQESKNRNGFTVILEDITLEEEHVKELEGKEGSFFYAGWEPGSIKVNGEEPYLLGSHPEKYTPLKSVLGKPIGFVPQNYKGHVAYYDKEIVFYCGVVKYSYSREVLEKKLPSMKKYLSNLRGHFISVPIGTVDMVPSRDDFAWTEKTTSNLIEIIKNFIEEYRYMVSQKISKMEGRNKIETIIAYDWLVDDGAFSHVKAAISYEGENYNPFGEMTVITRGEKASTEKRTMASLLMSHVNEILIIADADGEKDRRWVSSNLSDLAYSLDYEPKNISVVLLHPELYSENEALFRGAFPVFTKKEVTDLCREYRKKKIVPKNDKFISVIVHDVEGFHVEDKLPEDIDLTRTVFISDEDKVVPPKEQAALLAGTPNQALFAMNKLVRSMGLLDAKVNQYIFWGKRLPSTLMKAAPGIRSVNEVFSAYFNSLPDSEKKAIMYVAYFANSNLYDEFRYVASVSQKWVTEKRHVENESFQTLMNFWGVSADSDDFIVKTLTAVLLKNFLPGGLEEIKQPENSLCSLLPLLFAKYVNFNQVESYMNAVGFPVTSEVSDVSYGFALHEYYSNVEIYSSPLRLTIFMEQFSALNIHSFYYFRAKV